MRGNFFDKHVAQCVGNIRKKVEGMYIFAICHLCRSYHVTTITRKIFETNFSFDVK